MDGLCRINCNITFNGCPVGNLTCPNGLCVESLAECAGVSSCDDDTPFKCVDNTCVKEINECPQPFRYTTFDPFVITVAPTAQRKISFLYDENLISQGQIKIPAGSLLTPLGALTPPKPTPSMSAVRV